MKAATDILKASTADLHKRAESTKFILDLLRCWVRQPLLRVAFFEFSVTGQRSAYLGTECLR